MVLAHTHVHLQVQMQMDHYHLHAPHCQTRHDLQAALCKRLARGGRTMALAVLVQAIEPMSAQMQRDRWLLMHLWTCETS